MAAARAGQQRGVIRAIPSAGAEEDEVDLGWRQKSKADPSLLIMSTLTAQFFLCVSFCC